MESQEEGNGAREIDRRSKQPTPEEIQRREKLVTFLQGFVKAMQQTTYYPPDHPMAKKSREGLYEAFLGLLGDNREVSFLARFEKGVGKDIFIDGVTEEPTSLTTVMTTTQSELFLPKFSEYFHRRGLVSFSLKNDITEDEFGRFVDVMSESKRSDFDDALQKGKELTMDMIDNQIIHVSTVFDDDVVKISRTVPWRVEMTLFRLRKDLSVIPMFKHLKPEEISKIKKEVIQDIIRPIIQPVLFVDLLLNARHVTGDVKGLQDVDIEAEIIGQTKPAFIEQVIERLADKLPTADSTDSDSETEETADDIKRLLRKLGGRMVESGAEDAVRTMYRLYDLQVLSFEELPESIQQRMRMEKMADEFIEEGMLHLKILRNTDDAAVYQNTVDVIEQIFPELIKRGEFKILTDVLEMLSSHWGDDNPPFEDRPDIATEAMENIESQSNRTLLMESLENSPRETRHYILSILEVFGPQAISELLTVLCSTEEAAIRNSICQSLEKMGSVAVPALSEALQKPDQPWYLIRNIMGVIGEVGSVRSVDLVATFKDHSHPRVREGALVALHKLMGPDAEPALVRALEDKDLHVSGRAMALLGSLKSRNSQVLEYYQKTLAPESESSDKEQFQVCLSLGLLGEIEFPDGTNSVELLNNILARGKPGKLFGLIKEDGTAPSNVRLQAAVALGKINTPAALAVLKKFVKDKDAEVSKIAEEALG